MINAEKYLEELRLVASNRKHGISKEGILLECKGFLSCDKCVSKPEDGLCDYSILKWALQEVEE